MKKTIFLANLMVVSSLMGMQDSYLEKDSFARGSVESADDFDNFKCFQQLVEWGMIDDSILEAGETFLTLAIKGMTDYRQLRLILDARDSEGNRCVNVNTKNAYGDTALAIAAQMKDTEAMLLLLRNGADVKLVKGKVSESVYGNLERLDQQVEKEQRSFREWVLKIVQMKKANKDFNRPQNSAGETILMQATREADCRIMQQILNAKDSKGYRLVDINAKTAAGDTALSIAAQMGNEQKMLLLLRNGAKMMSETERGWTYDLYKHNRKVVDDSMMFLNAINYYPGDILALSWRMLGRDVKCRVENSDPFLGREALRREAAKKDKELLDVLSRPNGIDPKLFDLALKRLDIDLSTRRPNDGGSALTQATRNENVELVKILLKQPGVNVNVQTNDGYTPLFIAAHNGNEEIVKLLLERPIDPNIKINHKFTPLMVAVIKQHADIVNMLLDHGADMNDDQNAFHSTPLIYAIDNGDVRTIEALLKHEVDVNKKSENGNTPLIQAVENQDARIVKLLLDQPGINLTLKNDDGETALQCAERLGREKITNLIKSKMPVESSPIEPQQEEKVQMMQSEPSKEEIKPVSTKSIEERYWEAISQGRVNDSDSKDDLDIINGLDRILDEGKKIININKTNESGDTALLIASSKGYLAIVKVLLERDGVDLSIKDASGNNALIRAASENHIDIVNELLRHDKSIINAEGKDKKTALMVASERGYDGLVQLLIDQGAKIQTHGHKIVDQVKQDLQKLKRTKGNNSDKESMYNRLVSIKEMLEVREKEIEQRSKNTVPTEVGIQKLYKIIRERRFGDDLLKLNPKYRKFVDGLIEDIKSNPYTGSGKPEYLRGNLKGYWSRRINGEDRLVYKINKNKTVELKKCEGHYK